MVNFSNFTLILTICSSVILHCRQTVGFVGQKSKYSDKSLRRDTPDTIRSIFLCILLGTLLLHVPQIAILMIGPLAYQVKVGSGWVGSGPVARAIHLQGNLFDSTK